MAHAIGKKRMNFAYMTLMSDGMFNFFSFHFAVSHAKQQAEYLTIIASSRCIEAIFVPLGTTM
jgi:hypothetical protein